MEVTSNLEVGFATSNTEVGFVTSNLEAGFVKSNVEAGFVTSYYIQTLALLQVIHFLDLKAVSLSLEFSMVTL